MAMTRFLVLPLLLAASACTTSDYVVFASTESTLENWGPPIEANYEPFVFDGVTIDSAPACRVDDLSDIEAEHTEEAKLVLRDREFLPLAC